MTVRARKADIGMAVLLNSRPELVRLEYEPRLRDRLRLPEQDVHVWLGQFEHDSNGLHSNLELLSADERERMRRFHFQADRENFVFARSMLRILLASYLDASPAELRFLYSAHGKPSLRSPQSHDLQFNLSHSGGKVLLAVCRGRRVGVDIEQVRRDFDIEEISTQFFSAEERQALRRISTPLRHKAFFHCWTRKEAFVKARGDGLSCPLKAFDVSVDPRDEQVSLVMRGDAREIGSWELHSLNTLPEFAAAIALECARKG